MKYLLTVLLCAFIAASFIDRKCDHVFVSVEQPEIKIEMSGNALDVIHTWPTGKQQGKDLICVKCFQQIKQTVDYGTPNCGQLIWRQSSAINAGPYNDSLLTRSASGWLKTDDDSVVAFGHPILWSESSNVVDSAFYRIIRKHQPHKIKKLRRNAAR